MPLTKVQANEKIKEMFITDMDVTNEEALKKNQRKFHKEVLSVYGSWDKALRANGISKRKQIQREKFVLYFMLKDRKEKYGPESVRPKNIQPEEFKDRIVRTFKTYKALKDIVENWNEDKVMFELHGAILTGETIPTIKENDSELYENMLAEFSTVEAAIEQYNKRFGLPKITMEELGLNASDTTAINKSAEVNNATEESVTTEGAKVEDQVSLPKAETIEEEQETTQNETEVVVREEAKTQKENAPVASDDLIDMLIRLNYIDEEEDAQAIILASKRTKQEVSSYLFQQLANAQATGTKVTEEAIKEQDASYYFAIKALYGGLDVAIKSITQDLLKSS